MKSKNPSKSSPKKPRIDLKNEVITREKLDPFYENIKNLIVSTAKGTENALMREINGVKGELQGVKRDIAQLQIAVTEHTGMIKALDVKIDGVRTELKEEIRGVRTELKDEMHKMEDRLSDKMVGNAARLDDHEIRISSLESSRT